MAPSSARRRGGWPPRMAQQLVSPSWQVYLGTRYNGDEATLKQLASEHKIAATGRLERGALRQVTAAATLAAADNVAGVLARAAGAAFSAALVAAAPDFFPVDALCQRVRLLLT